MRLGRLLYHLYRFRRRRLRETILWLLHKIEGGPLYSVTLRQIFREYHDVEVGMYTHGSCFVPGNFDRFTTVGRYCSIAADVRVFNRDHPMDFKSTHAFFFNPALHATGDDLVKYNPLRIGNDVWIGYGVIILPGVREIGDGAVIGAGSVVSKNVPPYAVAVGHPIRIVRFRFPHQVIEELLKERWWEKDIEDLKHDFGDYSQPYEATLAARQSMGQGCNEPCISGQRKPEG